MATRAVIRFANREKGQSFSSQGNAIHAQIYHHYDGYPEGLGVELAEYLDGFKVVNGYGQKTSKVANGISCLSASVLSYLKDGPGNVYLDHPDTERTDLDYVYYVWATENKDIYISIFQYYNDECIFVGEPRTLIEKYEHTN